MKKTLLLGLPSTLLLLVLLIFFDTGLARVLANQYLRSQSIEITCLDYDIALSGQLKARTLCISLPSVKVLATDVKVEDWGNQIHAEQLEIRLQDGDTSVSQEPIVLPNALPLVSVNKATLKINESLPPVPLAIQSISESELLVDSQWRLFISLKDRKINAKLDWKPVDIQAWLPQSFSEAIPQKLLSSPMTTRIEFDGSKVNILQPIELQHELEMAQCTVRLASMGDIYASLDTRDLSARVDASKLLTEAQLDSCEVVPELAGNINKLNINLFVPEMIEWKNQLLSAPKLVVNSTDKLDLNATLTNTQYSPDSGLTSAFLLQASGPEEAKVNSSAQISFKEGNLNIDEGSAQLRVTKFTHNELTFDTFTLSSSFALSNSVDVTADANIKIGKIQKINWSAADISVRTTLESQGLSNWNIALQSELSAFSDEFVEVKNLVSDLKGNLSGNDAMQLAGSTVIDDIALNNINMGSFTINHKIEQQLSQSLHSSHHTVSSPDGLDANIELDNQFADIAFPAQPVSQFNSALKQQFPDANILSGQWQGSMRFDLSNQTLGGMLDILSVDLEYDTYAVKELNFSPMFNVDSAGLQLTPTRLTADRLFTGIPITNFESEISSQDGDLVAQSIKAELLGGEFNVATLGLHQNDQQIDLQFDRIDIATLLQIQEAAGVQGPGIRVTGKIGGSIPLAVSDNKISIDQGKLANLGPGWLRIEGNTAFESLKASQPEISGQLSVLENLNFDTLTSDISMQPDGLVKMSMQIQGTNPDVNQDIVFNYNHEQNLFTLLKSIRLSKEIQDKVNDALSGDN